MYKIHSEELSYQANSEQLFDRLRDLPQAIWLDSGKPRSLQGRFDIISACPESVLESKNSMPITIDGQPTSIASDSFDCAKHLLNSIQPIEALPDVPFVCGLIGFLAMISAVKLNRSRLVTIVLQRSQTCALGYICGV